MRYIIQRFVTEEGSNVGQWRNTNWGSENYDKAIANAESAFATGKFAGIRVVELLWEKHAAPSHSDSPSI